MSKFSGRLLMLLKKFSFLYKCGHLLSTQAPLCHPAAHSAVPCVNTHSPVPPSNYWSQSLLMLFYFGVVVT